MTDLMWATTLEASSTSVSPLTALNSVTFETPSSSSIVSLVATNLTDMILVSSDAISNAANRALLPPHLSPSKTSTPFPDCRDDNKFTGIVNFTEFNFPGTTKSGRDIGWDECFKIVLYLCAMVASLFGNLAVVVAVCVKRTLRMTVNLYLANLAFADILICVCCMWVHLVNHLTAPKYVLGPLLCKFNGFAQMTCLTSSVLILSAISCDRYMAIMFPLRSRVTKQRTGTVIVSIWVFSLFISLPFLFYRRLQTLQWSDYTETNCLEAWPSEAHYSAELGTCVQKHVFKQVYYTLVSTVLFFAPVLIMITAYSAIIWKLWLNKMPGEAHYANVRHSKKSKRKVIQMVVVVLLVFVVCWLPLQLVVLYSLYLHSTKDGVLPEWFPKLSYYSTFIAYSNSAFNPLIYGGFNKNFRDALCNNAICALWWKKKGSRLKRPQYSSKSFSTMVTSVNRGDNGTTTAQDQPGFDSIDSTATSTDPMPTIQVNRNSVQTTTTTANNNNNTETRNGLDHCTDNGNDSNGGRSLMAHIAHTDHTQVKAQMFEMDTLTGGHCSDQVSFL